MVVGDDFGTYDAGAYRGGRIPTPEIDALAAKGLLMTSFYVFQICSPTRSSLVSGRYPFHVSQQLPEGFHAISRQYELLPALLECTPATAPWAAERAVVVSLFESDAFRHNSNLNSTEHRSDCWRF